MALRRGPDRGVRRRPARDRAAAGRGVVHAETTGWLYRHDRDLTGFVDGTENPSLVDAPSVVAVPDGEPGAGSSVVLHQLWRHDTARWEGEPVATQERAMGRTKPDSIELDPLPVESHVARTTLEVDGEEKDIFRRNVAYGGVGDHGTVFVGFSLEQWRLAEMLRRMAGVPDGVRCALTRYLSPLTGAYYVVPSVGALGRFAPPEERHRPAPVVGRCTRCGVLPCLRSPTARATPHSGCTAGRVKRAPGLPTTQA